MGRLEHQEPHTNLLFPLEQTWGRQPRHRKAQPGGESKVLYQNGARWTCSQGYLWVGEGLDPSREHLGYHLRPDQHWGWEMTTNSFLPTSSWPLCLRAARASGIFSVKQLREDQLESHKKNLYRWSRKVGRRKQSPLSNLWWSKYPIFEYIFSLNCPEIHFPIVSFDLLEPHSSLITKYIW